MLFFSDDNIPELVVHGIDDANARNARQNLEKPYAHVKSDPKNSEKKVSSAP